MLDVSNTLRTLRNLHGFSQAEVAKNLEISTSTYSRLENNQQKPSFHVINKIINLYHIDANTLFGIGSFSDEYNELINQFSNPKTKELLDNSIKNHIKNIEPLLKQIDKQQENT